MTEPQEPALAPEDDDDYHLFVEEEGVVVSAEDLFDLPTAARSLPGMDPVDSAAAMDASTDAEAEPEAAAEPAWWTRWRLPAALVGAGLFSFLVVGVVIKKRSPPPDEVVEGPPAVEVSVPVIAAPIESPVTETPVALATEPPPKPVVAVVTEPPPKPVVAVVTEPPPKPVVAVVTEPPPKPVVAVVTEPPPKPVVAVVTEPPPKPVVPVATEPLRKPVVAVATEPPLQPVMPALPVIHRTGRERLDTIEAALAAGRREFARIEIGRLLLETDALPEPEREETRAQAELWLAYLFQDAADQARGLPR